MKQSLQHTTTKLISQKFMGKQREESLRPTVNLVFRKPSSSSNSIEFLFNRIAEKISDNIQVKRFILPCLSTGIFNRIKNTVSLARFRNGIVHITGDTYYVILGARRCKRMITIHDLSFLERTKGWKRNLLKLLWVTWPVKYSHRITVVSDATRKALLKEVNVKPEKVVVVSNFVDDIYQPVERKFNSSNPRILQVGTDFNKNILRLAEALEGIPCTLVIIGKLNGIQKQYLERFHISYINRFSLTLEEIHEEYLKADLLSFISTVEGFGLPVVEAQSTGLPVITSNCSSMPEVAGRGALLVDPYDVKAIKEGLLKLINNPVLRKQIIEEGYTNARKYSVDKVAADYLRIYSELSADIS